jgi:hypothetical protein
MIKNNLIIKCGCKKTGFKSSDKFPETCPWSITPILMEGWLPV